MPPARSGNCHKCGAKIRPTAKDMSLAAASRKHYWKHHREVMMAGVRKAQKTLRAKKKARR
ncbi:MAG: hypothetical protein WD826_08575 [Actinomycetota bacterium]